MRDLGLPSTFGTVRLGEWAGLSAAAARDRGEVLEPAVMLVYSRFGACCYDEIAERIAAVMPPDPSGGLVGRRTMMAANERARRSRRPPELEAVRTEQDLLGHRPLDLPDTDGRMQYVISDDTITIRIDDSPVDWRFALSYPPAASYRRVPTTRLRRSRGRSSRR